MMWKSACSALVLVAALTIAGCGADNSCNCSNVPGKTSTPAGSTPRPTTTPGGLPTVTGGSPVATLTGGSPGPTSGSPVPTPTGSGVGCEGSQLTLTVTSQDGSDLDTGWTGIAHNSVA